MHIANTDQTARHPWPEGHTHTLQGGAHGVVFPAGTLRAVFDEAANGEVKTLAAELDHARETAFVEAFVDGTFIRGEGTTVTDAEDACWAEYVKQSGCTSHEYEPRNYRNGGGICRHCGRFEARTFTGEQLGQYCWHCQVPTTYHWQTYDHVGEIFACAQHTPRSRYGF